MVARMCLTRGDDAATGRHGDTATDAAILSPASPPSPCPRVSLVRMQAFKGSRMLS